jgi:hypothetical protein
MVAKLQTQVDFLTKSTKQLNGGSWGWIKKRIWYPYERW